MKINNKKLIIFDLDGTLVNAYKAIANSLNYVRQKLGYDDIAFKIIKKNIGHGDKNFVAEFFFKKDLNKALELYRAHHKKSLKKYSKAKPYARMLLYNLKRKHKLLAIASNRPAAYTAIILKSLGMKKYFDYILCADEIKSLKPNPKILYKILKKLKVKKEAAIYAGDMNVDMETAQRAKVDAFFITGGSSKIVDVKKYKDKKIIKSLKEILKI
ncbi:MAG: HAD family hydrolase [Candidatus Omnitrophota bacterium]